MKIIVNSFARNRHYKGTGFSYPEVSWEEVIRRTISRFGYAGAGYRNGVLVVPIIPDGIYSGVTKLEPGARLIGRYEARREGEEPRKQVRTPGAALPAKAVDIILYESIVLAEDGDNEQPASPGNWEIVSVNARATEGPEPIHPMTLCANHFGMDGGTDTMMSPVEFERAMRESCEYWKDKAMLIPQEEDPAIAVSLALRKAVSSRVIDIKALSYIAGRLKDKI